MSFWFMKLMLRRCYDCSVWRHRTERTKCRWKIASNLARIINVISYEDWYIQRIDLGGSFHLFPPAPSITSRTFFVDHEKADKCQHHRLDHSEEQTIGSDSLWNHPLSESTTFLRILKLSNECDRTCLWEDPNHWQHQTLQNLFQFFSLWHFCPRPHWPSLRNQHL